MPQLFSTSVNFQEAIAAVPLIDEGIDHANARFVARQAAAHALQAIQPDREQAVEAVRPAHDRTWSAWQDVAEILRKNWEWSADIVSFEQPAITLAVPNDTPESGDTLLRVNFNLSVPDMFQALKYKEAEDSAMKPKTGRAREIVRKPKHERDATDIGSRVAAALQATIDLEDHRKTVGLESIDYKLTREGDEQPLIEGMVSAAVTTKYDLVDYTRVFTDVCLKPAGSNELLWAYRNGTLPKYLAPSLAAAEQRLGKQEQADAYILGMLRASRIYQWSMGAIDIKRSLRLHEQDRLVRSHQTASDAAR